jgi:ABC-2 type transport system ATP-binding protein
MTFEPDRTNRRVPAADSQAAVHLVGLRKSYGATLAVDRVDLDVAPGEIVALLGPNGAGKSTTVDLLLGLARPDAGQATLFGLSPGRACAAGHVGAMLQSGGLPPEISVRELVGLMRSLYPRASELDEVLARAGVADLADRRTTALSGGQAQRVRFALALVPDPDLLVLDEPTAAMDVESRQAFWSAMRAWASSGRTVLFATHYLEEADSFADRVVLLRHGRVVADAPPAEIRAMAGGRTIRARLETPLIPTIEELADLAGVTHATVVGPAITLRCTDSDATLRAALARWPDLHDIEVSAPGLDEAFVALTSDAAITTDTGPEPTGMSVANQEVTR